MKPSELLGKTITSAKRKKLAEYYDEGFLELQLSDETQATIIAGYLDYTSNSIGEYPTYINIENTPNEELIDLNDEEK